ncbi:MAG: hypothetical protein NVS4B12_25250 [Ktedonobacteraceae bacterium]
MAKSKGDDHQWPHVFLYVRPHRYTTIGMAPISYRHPHNPAHTPDHILSSIIGPSLAVPYANGKLLLGIWQRIVLVELDGPRQRTVHVSHAE